MSRLLAAIEAETIVREAIRDGIATQERMLAQNASDVVRVAQLLIDTFKGGGRLFLLGNGGSAAEAQHVAAEFVGRFRRDRDALPAMALNTDPSIITAVGNDVDFAQIFARQVEALVERGDVLAVLSTSGASPNVLEAVKVAKRVGATTVGFTGQRRGPLVSLVDMVVEVPSSDTARIQEAHLVMWHVICDLVERAWVWSI